MSISPPLKRLPLVTKVVNRQKETNTMSVVGVFKTNVNKKSDARTILDAIQRHFPFSDPSFDLEDCDRVLRVESPVEEIDDSEIGAILDMFGFQMESMI